MTYNIYEVLYLESERKNSKLENKVDNLLNQILVLSNDYYSLKKENEELLCKIKSYERIRNKELIIGSVNQDLEKF